MAGNYQVAGWQDLNGNGQVDTGEPFGIYVNAVTGKSGVSIDAVSRSVLGINVQLRPLQTTGAAADPSAPSTARALEAVVKRVR